MSQLDNIERVGAFGFRFSNVSFAEAVNLIADMTAEPGAKYAVTPNVDHLVFIERDPEARRVCEQADLVLCDGMPIKWSLAMLGTPLRERVCGADLVAPLCREAARRGLRVFFLGARPGIARECARRMSELNPDLSVAGTLAPRMRFEEGPAAAKAVVETVRDAKPDLLFVALGSPRQEKFIHDHREEIGAGMCIGVGAAFDFIVGRQKRAPIWLREAGFEWLWRLAGDPIRLYRRYLVDALMFPRIVWREWRKRRER